MNVSLSFCSFNQQTSQKNKHLDMKRVLISLSLAHLPTQSKVKTRNHPHIWVPRPCRPSLYVYTVNNDELDVYVHQTLTRCRGTSHLLGQEVDSHGVFVCVRPQLDLSQNLTETEKFSVLASSVHLSHFERPPASSSRHLIGEGVAHDEGRVSHGAAQVDQSALGQNDDVTTVFQEVAIDLRRRRTRR